MSIVQETISKHATMVINIDNWMKKNLSLACLNSTGGNVQPECIAEAGQERVETPNWGCSARWLCPWVHKDGIKGMIGVLLLLEYLFSRRYKKCHSRQRWGALPLTALGEDIALRWGGWIKALLLSALCTWGRLPALPWRVLPPGAVWKHQHSWWEWVRLDSLHLLCVCVVKEGKVEGSGLCSWAAQQGCQPKHWFVWTFTWASELGAWKACGVSQDLSGVASLWLCLLDWCFCAKNKQPLLSPFWHWAVWLGNIKTNPSYFFRVEHPRTFIDRLKNWLVWQVLKPHVS